MTSGFAAEPDNLVPATAANPGTTTSATSGLAATAATTQTDVQNQLRAQAIAMMNPFSQVCSLITSLPFFTDLASFGDQVTNGGTGALFAAIQHFADELGGLTISGPNVDVTPTSLMNIISPIVSTLQTLFGDLTVATVVQALETFFSQFVSNFGGLSSTLQSDLQGVLGTVEKAISGFAQYIGIGNIGLTPTELLKNPVFTAADSIAGGGVWNFDALISHTADGTGSVSVTADGTLKELVSDPPVLVGQGQTLTHSIWLMWSSVTAAVGNAFTLGVNFYNNLGALLSQTDLAHVATPAAASTWTQLTGTTAIPAGATSMRVRLNVAASVSAGVIHFDDASSQGTGILPAAGVASTAGTANIGTDVQAIIDGVNQSVGQAAGQIATSVQTALEAIPHLNVIGNLGPIDIGSSLAAVVDGAVQGLVIPGTFVPGNSIAQLTSAAHGLFTTANQASNIAQNVSSTLAARAATKPGLVGVDPSADGVFNLSQLTATATAFNSTIPITSGGASVIGYITTPDGGLKKSVMWLGSYTGTISTLQFNLYQVNPANGQMLYMASSGNLIGSVASTLTWNYWSLPTANQFQTVPGNVYAVEMYTTGTGTYSVVGLPNHWLPNNNRMTGIYPTTLGASIASPAVPTAVRASVNNVGTLSNNTTTGKTLTQTTTLTIGAGTTALLFFASYWTGTAQTPTFTATVGGATLQVLTQPQTSYYGSVLLGFVNAGGITSGSVSASITMTVANSDTLVMSSIPLAYANVSAFGVPQNAAVASGSGVLTQTVTTTAQPNQVIAQMFALAPLVGSSLTGYSQTVSVNQTVSGNYGALVIGYGNASSTSTNVYVTELGGAAAYTAVALPLLSQTIVSAPAGSANVPWFGLGGGEGVAQYVPTITPFGAAVSGGTAGTYPYSIPPWANHLDVVALGAGGAGQGGQSLIAGGGGFPGSFRSVTYNIGIDIPTTTTTLTVTVGAGGANATGLGAAGGNGGATTVTGTGMTTVNAGGGAGATSYPGNAIGGSPGTLTYDGQTYPGGGAENTVGGNGNGPGGGGAGGAALHLAGNGADGGAWIMAYQ